MGSSSKAKSSKKKSSKIRSQPRKMKRAKKSRSSKSKKVARRHDTSSDDSRSSQSISSASNDSYSLYSDSDSMSSVSFSSSSSEGTYRGKKKVSRLRSKLKSTRKKVGRSSSNGEDFSRKKKRNGSRNADSKSWKKSKKNKSRRNVRNSSATSDSHDFSTCKEESGSLSEESQVPKLMFKSRENKRHKRESREERVGTENRSHRSRSSSSYDRFRDQSYSGSQGDGIFVDEHKSRRLRSVIIFAEQAHEKEGNKSGKDSLKDEIVYDRDDYPSPRSNDSSSGGSKRDVNSCSPVASGDRRQKENVEGQETCVSNVGATEVIIESRKNANDPKVHDPFLNEVEMNKYEKESRTYGSLLDTNLGADDLETVLRQKALENLRKFRGGIQRNVKATTNQINSIDEDGKESFSSKAEIVQRVLPKQDNTNGIEQVKILEIGTRTTSSMGGVSYPHKDIADRGNTVTESGIVKQKATHPPDGLALSVSSLKEDHRTAQAAVVKSESQNSVFGGKASSMNSSLNQEMILQSSPDKKLNENRESEREILPKTTNSITSGNSEAVVNNASSEQSTSQGQGSNEQQTETKDGAQFEQKTMSVMRGGEMVQVNYKVYIPKRAPALSRRQLKR